MRKVLICITVLLSLTTFSCKDEEKSTAMTGEVPAQSNEDFRPRFHFTPQSGWMNDPNGMFYLDGTYHLFFQHNPDDNVWGPMHWGHATSKDLIVWEEQPIALEPDEFGTIFSGSAVVDHQNTSGLGDGQTPPVIAIFTYHDAEREKEGEDDFQTQGIAYSIDAGKIWTKYGNNPVLKNPGIRDFRDPKVVWYEEESKWIMSLAVQDHISFYSSPNLLDWEHLSDFGKNEGNHGGVWECPDLFKMQVNGTGEERWVLLVSINPGGPNGGSATQYFVGDFDGTTFTLDETVANIGEEHKYWIDFGKDNYAGVTWSNIPEEDGRHLFMGWMSNWQYANEVPTETWRSAMTIARELELEHTGESYRITSTPVKELDSYKAEKITTQDVAVESETELHKNGESSLSPSVIEITIADFKEQDYVFRLKDETGDILEFGYDAKEASYYVDRSKAGITNFNEDFAANRSLAPRISPAEDLKFTAIIDNMSIEIFFDDGSTVMTEIFFTNQPFRSFTTNGSEGFNIQQFEISQLEK